MRSRAHIKSHPLHPILVVFPLAFFTATFIFELLYIANDNHYFGQTAVLMNIAGIIGALAAAIPGIIDFLYTVPPNSSAKKRGIKHGILNVTVLVIFSLVFYLRKDVPPGVLVTLEGAGLVMMLIAGWMGGTLVHRNQIGVDIRYAHAGKWVEKHVEVNAGIAEAGRIDELKTNQMMLLHIGSRRIVVGKTETAFVAFDDHCTHKGGTLAGGSMICGTVQCPWHGSQFDCRTGEVMAGPAKRKISTYEVGVRDSILELYINKPPSNNSEL